MIIAASGHRPDRLGGHGTQARNLLLSLARGYLRRREVDMAISGMAEGWDQAWAAAALELGIPLLCAVPFEGQDRPWSPTSRKEYRRLLNAAKQVVVVSEGGPAQAKFLARNRWMVDHCDHLCVMWNETGWASGTAHTVSYAKAQGRPYDNLWHTWKMRTAA